ncbi:MAG: hypothetical protein QQN41_12195, partial [Nitrosopumilus sp.]
MDFIEIPSWKKILAQYEGECPLCHSKTKLIDGEFGLFFGCTKFFENGCKGKTKPSKEILEEIEEWGKCIKHAEENNDARCGLMDCYPEWDPDE